MKLNDLIDALAGEIELAMPQLQSSLDELAVLPAEEPAFLDALDQYGGQTQRMGEAAEMVGLPGLQSVCAHVLENILMLPSLAPHERAPMLEFLREWPPLIMFHLRNYADPSSAAGLVDHLCKAPHPLDDEQALRIMHMLGAMPSLVHSADTQVAQQRPVLARPEDAALDLPGDVDPSLLAGFLHEAPEQARNLSDLAAKIAAGQGAPGDLAAAKRVAHTLKGSGAIIGLRGLSSLGHHFEDILEHFEREGGEVALPAAEVLLDAAYCLEQMVGYVAGADDFPAHALTVLQNVLDLANRIDHGEELDEPVTRMGSLLAPLSLDGEGSARPPRAPAAAAPQPMPMPARQAAPAPAEPPAEHEIAQGLADMLPPLSHEAPAAPKAAPGTPPPAREAAAAAAQAPTLRVGLQRVEELFRVTGEVNVQAAALESHIKRLTLRSRELLAQNLRVQKRLFELETLVDVRAITMMRSQTRRPEGDGFDPLEMNQYSELHSVTHALMEEAADARALASRLDEDLSQLGAVQGRQQRLGRELQHLVLGTRMGEVGTLESRLRRTVRATAQATGKQAVLTLRGADTLVDSDVLERMAEPLLHLLRNAVDHGLESPAERLMAGKSAEGTIALSFSRQGQQVVLRCADDGRGLDLPAIRRRAEARGLVSPERVLTDDETARLILMPGFSTRDVVTEVSGRGVGLDVVHEWAGAMNGSLRIQFTRGQGCTFELRFAASLSSVQSLVVDVGGERLALASLQVEQAVPRGVGHFETLGERPMYRLGARLMPALRLADVAALPANADKPWNDHDVVVVKLDDRVTALAVDALLDARELLVKGAGRYARHLRGVAGLAILGDGGVAVHLDLVQLLLRAQTRRPVQGHAMAPARTAAAKPGGILIVDDALSVRNALLQVVRDAGFRAEAARDGVEAIDAMRRFTPAMVLTDLEMPNMTGIELTNHIRGREDLQHLPIVMITSRSQDKHRQAAQRAGVNVYLTKPFNDEELLGVIRQALAQRVPEGAV